MSQASEFGFVSAFDDMVFRAECLLRTDILAYGKETRRELVRRIARALRCSYSTANEIIEDLLGQGVLKWVDYGYLGIERRN